MPLDLEALGHVEDLFDFDLTAPTSSATTTSVLGFDFPGPPLDSFSTRLAFSLHEEDQMTVYKNLYLVAKPHCPAHIAPWPKARIEYSIEQLKLAPKMMVEQNCTPWAHPNLYDDFMPRSLQDAYAGCALYITRNSTNTEHVTRYITTHVGDVITSAFPSEHIEILARAHALMLYQIMFVFGDEMRVSGQAEEVITHLEEVGEGLLAIADEQTDTTGSLPLYPSTAARSAWQSFVFRESVRRTVLSVFQFTGVCNLLRGQLRMCADSLAIGNRLTLSAHLWNAKNAFDFAMAWNNEKHFLVKGLDFTDVLRDAKPDDLDVFAKMMLVGLQGIDDVRGWFYMRGGVL